MERIARFGCFMFWSGLVVGAGLIYFYLNGDVPLYRLLDVVSITFFFALFLATLDALFDARNKPVAGLFLLIFVAITFIPSALGRQYPEISRGHSDWLFLSFCAVASAPTIIWSVIQRKEKEISTGGLVWMIIVEWSAVLGISFWLSLFKGAWLSISEIGLSFLAALGGAFVGLVVWVIMLGLFEIVDKITSMHRKGFLKKAEDCSES